MMLASRAPRRRQRRRPARAGPLRGCDADRRGRAGGGAPADGRADAAAAADAVKARQRRGRGATPGQQFQSLELLADQAGLARADDSERQPERLRRAGSAAARIFPGHVDGIGDDDRHRRRRTPGFFGPNGPGDFAERFGNGLGGGDARSSERRDRPARRAGWTGRTRRVRGGRGGFGGPFGGAAAAAIRSAAACIRASIRRRSTPRRSR